MTCGTDALDSNDVNCCRAQASDPNTCTGTNLCASNVCVECTATVGTEATACEAGRDNSWFCSNDTADSGSILPGQCFQI
jgi:hypothetical protein